MNQITQGSVISGVRFENYKGTYCSAIVITARCDLANKGKVGKVFYLCAVPLKEWVLSRKGIGIIAAKDIRNCQEKLESITKRYGLDLNALIQFSEEEVQTVLLDVKMNEQHINELRENLRIKKEFASIKYSNSRFIELLKDDKFKKELVAKLKEIADGKNTHLCFIPRDAYNSDMCFSDGLIVDLEEWKCQVLCSLKTHKNQFGIGTEQLDRYLSSFCAVGEGRKFSRRGLCRAGSVVA